MEVFDDDDDGCVVVVVAVEEMMMVVVVILGVGAWMMEVSFHSFEQEHYWKASVIQTELLLCGFVVVAYACTGTGV